MSRKSLRLKWAVEALGAEIGADLHFLTLTTPDVVTPKEISARWRALLNSRTWRGLRLRYVMVFEKHPGGHGWHIHVVINRFVRVDVLRPLLAANGFGRFEIDRVTNPSAVGIYIGKYLAKSLRVYRAEHGARHFRMVNVSRGLTRLVDVEYHDGLTDVCRAVYGRVRSSLSISPYHLMHSIRHIALSWPYYNLLYLAGHGIKFGVLDEVLLAYLSEIGICENS